MQEGLGVRAFSTREIRDMFRDFFVSKDHISLPSASLVPGNDPTLLLTGAGMVPFKPYYMGTATPEYLRATTCQKCIRTLDIENVGMTSRHLTFFEMLGNFSFGDYFKEDAIVWAWEFVINHLGLPADKLWITIYLDDDEAFDIWNREIGVPSERIVRLGKPDNFWEIGVGPCGPCSEIHVDRGEAFGCGQPDCRLGCDCDRFMEIWNLVFIQFYCDEKGEYRPLDRKGIDTGMGLERIAAVMQGAPTVFDTDSLKPITKAILDAQGIGGRPDDKQTASLRIVADHARAVSFLIADGVLPSNEGRGYVLRRLLRRAIRHGRLLGIRRPFMVEMADVVSSVFSHAYPELVARRNHIYKVISSEEERFLERLDQGTTMLHEVVADLESQGSLVIPGSKAFKLYDTYGFPLELTREIAGESGMSVDEEGFNKAMDEQRERARASRHGLGYMGGLSTEKAEALSGLNVKFMGYEALAAESNIIAIFSEGEPVGHISSGQEGEIVLDRTPFYAEAGGQVGDVGIIAGEGFSAQVNNTIRISDSVISHYVTVLKGDVSIGDRAKAQVDVDVRCATARNHTATHLLHAALRKVLGDHVLQAGSYVSGDRLRFDFSHHSQVDESELRKVEDIVAKWILDDLSVKAETMLMSEAEKIGAIALFGEKYGDNVRVVRIERAGAELCGGTHVDRTGQIGVVKITSESAVASGVRRIEAISGYSVLDYIRSNEVILDNTADALKCNRKEIPDKVLRLQQDLKELEKEIESLTLKAASSKVHDLISEAAEVNGAKIVIGGVDGLDEHAIRELADRIRGRLGSGVVVLGSRFDEKVLFVAMVTKDLIDQGVRAGDIVKVAAKITGGGGGGRPDMAQAGGKDVSRLDEALGQTRSFIESRLVLGKEAR